MIIKPVSDLRNSYSKIETLLESNEPVFLTKNGEDSAVLMSLAAYEELEKKIKILQEQLEELVTVEETYGGLLETEVEARETNKRYDLEDLRKITEDIIDKIKI